MPTVTYGVFRASDAAVVVDLLARVFSAAEPPAVAMGITQAEMKRFVTLLCPAAAADGLTVIARVLETDQIVGVLLTDDFGAPLTIDLSEISGKFMPILNMLEGLDQNYRKGRAIVAGQYLHLFMLAVDTHFVGQGIAQQLVTACLLNGRQKGYTHAVTEATGVVSQRVFRKLDFTDRVCVTYRDYRYDGRPVFASILDHTATILMDRTIT